VLRTLAQRRARLFEHEVERWTGAPSGSEHLCRFLDHSGRWEKVTKANRAGWWVDLEEMRAVPATPSQYLRRLQLANEVLQDDFQLEGIETGPRAHDCRLRISQPHVQGESPSQRVLDEWIESWGFTVVSAHRIGAYDAVCCRRGSLWLFDVRPMNFVLTEDERGCIPIDVIVQHEDDQSDLDEW
jgi:hypothetical protein